MRVVVFGLFELSIVMSILGAIQRTHTQRSPIYQLKAGYTLQYLGAGVLKAYGISEPMNF